MAEGGRAWVEALPDETIQDAALVRSYPDWIAELWADAYGPEASRDLMNAGNATPEVAFRVSSLRLGADERVAEEFARLDCALRPDDEVPSACVVEGSVDIAATTAFRNGDLIPMSRSAQRIAPFLGPEPGMRVLDACAAPGGKSGHIADLLGGGRGLTCVERDPGRARALAETLAKCADLFEVLPGFAFFDDHNGLNAYATNRVRMQRADGTVLMGQRLLARLLRQPEAPDACVAAVCAHEFGHILQFKLGLADRLKKGQPTVKRVELQADFFAGYFAGTRKRERQAFPAAVFAMTQFTFGDNMVNSPDHHGTADERAAAVVKGFEASYRQKLNLNDAIAASLRYVSVL